MCMVAIDEQDIDCINVNKKRGIFLHKQNRFYFVQYADRKQRHKEMSKGKALRSMIGSANKMAPGVLTRLRRPPNDPSDAPKNKKDLLCVAVFKFLRK